MLVIPAHRRLSHVPEACLSYKKTAKQNKTNPNQTTTQTHKHTKTLQQTQQPNKTKKKVFCASHRVFYFQTQSFKFFSDFKVANIYCSKVRKQRKGK
jgi:hypothetical protein